MKFITPGSVHLIGPGAFCYVHFDSLVRISYEPHIRHPLILASLDSVTGHLEGQFLQVFSILSAAAEAWSASSRL
jgi:hypothetical protein